MHRNREWLTYKQSDFWRQHLDVQRELCGWGFGVAQVITMQRSIGFASGRRFKSKPSSRQKGSWLTGK